MIRKIKRELKWLKEEKKLKRKLKRKLKKEEEDSKFSFLKDASHVLFCGKRFFYFTASEDSVSTGCSFLISVLGNCASAFLLRALSSFFIVSS